VAKSPSVDVHSAAQIHNFYETSLEDQVPYGEPLLFYRWVPDTEQARDAHEVLRVYLDLLYKDNTNPVKDAFPRIAATLRGGKA
jgi:hypothetical protein